MTIEIAAEAPQKVGRFARLRNRVAGGLAGAAFAVGAPTAAFAGEPSAPGIDEVEQGFTSLQTTLTGVLIPSLIGLAVIGVVVLLGLRYLRRGARQA